MMLPSGVSMRSEPLAKIKDLMYVNGTEWPRCAHVPVRNYSLTRSLTHSLTKIKDLRTCPMTDCIGFNVPLNTS